MYDPIYIVRDGQEHPPDWLRVPMTRRRRFPWALTGLLACLGFWAWVQSWFGGELQRTDIVWVTPASEG